MGLLLRQDLQAPWLPLPSGGNLVTMSMAGAGLRLP